MAKKPIRIPWNKGKTGVQVPWNKGRKCPQMAGSNNGNWKEKVSYSGVHKWVERNKFKLGKCEFCDEIKPTTFANKSGKYLRNTNDWKELCYRCHWAFDRGRKYKNYYAKEIKEKHERDRIAKSRTKPTRTSRETSSNGK